MKRRLQTLIAFLLLGAIVNIAVAWALASQMPLDKSTMNQLFDSPKPTIYCDDKAVWFMWGYRRSGGMIFISQLMWIKGNDDLPVNKSLHFSAEGAFVWGNGYSSVSLGTEDGSYETPLTVLPAQLPTWSATRSGLLPRETQLEHDRWEVGTIGSREERAWGWPMVSMHDETWIRGQLSAHPILGLRRAAKTTSLAPRVVRHHGWSIGQSQSTTLPTVPVASGFVIDTLLYSATFYGIAISIPALRRHVRRRNRLCPGCGYPIGQSNVCTECGSPVTPKRIGVCA